MHRMFASREERSRRGKLVLTALVLAGTGSLAAFGTYATFTSTASGGPLSASTATVSISLGATGAKTNRLNIDATGLLPGDTFYRSVDLINGSSLDLSSITLTNTAAPSTLLDTDAVNGLHLKIDTCDQAWTEAGVNPAFTYTCGGTTAAVLARQAIIGTDLALTNLTALTHGNTDHLLFTIDLPNSADNTFQNLTSTFTFAFTGNQ